MKKAYWVVGYRSVTSPEALEAYTALAIPAIEGAGGRFVVRGFPSEVFEAGVPQQRTAVIEFESVEKALRLTTVTPMRRHVRLLTRARNATSVS